MALKWSEKKKAWLDPLTGQWFKGPAPKAEEPVIEKTVAEPEPVPQMLREAPAPTRSLSTEEVEWHMSGGEEQEEE